MVQPVNPQAAAPGPFSIFQRANGPPPANAPGQGKLLWEFAMTSVPARDLPVKPADVAEFGHNRGLWRWANGRGTSDRIGYETAWVIWQHQDRKPDGAGHDYASVIRFMFQDYGSTNQINDRGMVENPFSGPGETQGLAPYPYMAGKPALIDTSRPGASIEIFHLRMKPFPPNPDGTPRQGGAIKNQLLTKIIIPRVEPKNLATHWYRQPNGIEVIALNGNFVGADNPQGVIARLVVASMAGSGGPSAAYTYRMSGV